MIGATDLRGYNPIDTFQNLVTTAVDSAGTSSIYNATGSQISYLSVTTSFARSASFEIIYESSSSWADFAASASFGVSSSWAVSASWGITSSFAQTSSAAITASFTSATSSYARTSSFISPPGGAVATATIPTGSSAGAAGFTNAAELGTFILNVSASAVILNDLVAKLKLRGIIS